MSRELRKLSVLEEANLKDGGARLHANRLTSISSPKITRLWEQVQRLFKGLVALSLKVTCRCAIVVPGSATYSRDLVASLAKDAARW